MNSSENKKPDAFADRLDRPVVSIGGQNAKWLEPEIRQEADGWYRGEHVNFYREKWDVEKQFDVGEIRQWVLKGWLPSAPFITKDKLVTAFGSCFAWHIEKWLRQNGYKTSIGEYGGDPETSNYWSGSLIIKCGEGFVNTFALRSQFDWVFNDNEPELKIWQKSENVIREYIDSNKDAARKLFSETGVFVLTLGLSEVWYRRDTGQVLWTPVPKKHFDPNLYGFRVTTVEENLVNLQFILDTVRKQLGNVPVVITLSPVPLTATFRPVSCVTANAVSKAILRVAIDQFMTQNSMDQSLFYFPSYELVTSFFRDAWDEDLVHPSHEAIESIMRAFQAFYCRS